MASLIAKKKGKQLYYYVVESARVDASRALFTRRTSATPRRLPRWSRTALRRSPWRPPPSTSVCPVRFGWRPSAPASSNCSVAVASIAPPAPPPHIICCWPRIHRVCQPGPKTEVADWYDRTILRAQWGFAPERFTSQEFWDCFDRIPEEQLEQAQIRLLGLWKEKQLVSRRILAYDTTNFYTYVASTNERNHLAQRGHNKQGRHNLRTGGPELLLDGENGISLCHHVYPGNVADGGRTTGGAVAHVWCCWSRNQIARDTVTLVLDKGSAALANTLELEKSRRGLDLGLAWNQAPVELRDKERGATSGLRRCSSRRSGGSRKDAGTW